MGVVVQRVGHRELLGVRYEMAAEKGERRDVRH